MSDLDGTPGGGTASDLDGDGWPTFVPPVVTLSRPPAASDCAVVVVPVVSFRSPSDADAEAGPGAGGPVTEPDAQPPAAQASGTDAVADAAVPSDWTAAVAPSLGADDLVALGLTVAGRELTPSGWPTSWLRDLAAPTSAPKGRESDLVVLPVPPAAGLAVQAVGMLGLSASSTSTASRRAGAAVGRGLRTRGPVAVVLPPDLGPAQVQALVEGVVLGAYQTPRAPAPTTSDPEGGQPAAAALRVDLIVVSPDRGSDETVLEEAVRAGLRYAAATTGARDLASTPSNVKDPAWVAARARRAAESTGLRVTVLDVDRLRHEGFGGLLAVGAGSARPPALVRLEHVPVGGDPDERPLVVVGKGITYDTGGLSIKPRDSMVSMKTDMSGAGAVLEALRGCAAAGVRRRVVGLLPLAENAVGAASYRPSDVITHYGGTTVEVANTDAEGRLVLADALAYAVATLDPAAVVDVATLTGAATLGLGKRHAALYGEDEELLAALERAAEDSGERVWRMPLVEDYLPAVESSVADLRHVPEQTGIGGGSITAALFLRAFVGEVPWAHLDIAGPARADKDEHETCRGATGWGARLLLRWLESAAVPGQTRTAEQG